MPELAQNGLLDGFGIHVGGQTSFTAFPADKVPPQPYILQRKYLSKS